MPQQRSVSNLQPGTRYVVRVRAFNNLSVPSEWSEALEFTTPGDESVPSEIKNLRVDFTSPNLLLSWEPPTLNSDLTPLVDLAYYEVTLINGANSRTHTTTLLSFNYTLEYNRADWGTPSPTFRIEVRACDGSGNKSVPAVATATNLAPDDPTDPPELVSAFTIINISMSAPPNTQDLAGFRLEHSTDGAAWTLLAETIGNTYSHQVEQGSTHFYRYKVRDAFNQYSTNFSPTASTTTITTISQDTTPPAAPNLSVLEPNIALVDGKPYIHAAWTSGGEPDINRFDLRIKKTAAGLYTYYSVAKDVTTFDFLNLDADSTYFVNVRAADVTGNLSAWSNEQFTQTSHDTTAPTTPTGLATISGIESIFVNWNQNSELDFDHYNVCASKTSGFTPDINANKVYSGNANSFVHSATSGETWYYRVQAVDRYANASGFSAQVSGSPQVTNLRDTTPPTQPNSANITLTAGSELVAAIEVSYIDVSWPSNLNSESDLAGWHVLWKRSTDTTYSDTWVPKTATSVKLGGLISNTQYSVHLKAVDSSGNVSTASSPDNTITTPKDSTAPPAPSGIFASSGIRSINLQWTPSTLADFSHFEIYVANTPSFTPAAGYLYSNPTSGFENITRYSNGSSWADLLPGVTYYIMLRAVDRSGNASPYAGPISSTTGYVDNNDIAANTISGNVIQAGSLAADKITTGSLTATINISAALFRTGTAGARLEFDGAGIRGFATDGTTKNLEYKTADGSLRLVGPIVSGGQVSGATLSIGTSPNWLNIDTSGLWMGGSTFGNSPFTVDMTGNVIAKKLTIDSTGMTPTSTLINAGNFVLSAGGTVTASNVVATGGTIGGTTISPTALTGGVINGATFNIGTGGINFTGSGNITWQAGATGSIIVSNSGTIQSSNYVAGTTGWQLGPSGLEINQGSISAQTFQIGVSNKNLLFNSSFENGTTIATYWTAIGTGHTYSLDSSLFLYQSRSQKIISGGGTCGVTQTLSLGMTPPNFVNPITNTPLSVSIWVVQTTGATPRAVTLTVRSGGTTIATSTVTPTFNTWTRLAATGTVPSNVTYNSITVDLSYASTVATETFNIEGAQLQRSTYVTDYAPAPLEIPDNYIQAAYISSLNVDKLTGGTLNAQQINIGGTGYIQSINYDGVTAGYRLTSDKLIFQNGGINIVAQDGTVSLDNTGLKAVYGGQTKLQVDHTGVYIGGNNASNAAVTFDPATGKTIFKSAATGYTFVIDTAATGGGIANGTDKVLRLTDVAGNDTFYLKSDGTGFFAKGVVGLGAPTGGAGGAVITAGDTSTVPNRYYNTVRNAQGDSVPGDAAYAFYRLGESVTYQSGWYARWWNRTSTTIDTINYDVAPSATTNPGTINFTSPPAGVNATYHNAHFSGILQPTVSGSYNIYVNVDDGAQMWFNGYLAYDQYGRDGAAADLTPTYTVQLTAGKSYPMVVRYVNRTGGGSLNVQWSGPGIAKATIPANRVQSVASVTAPQNNSTTSLGAATYSGRPDVASGPLTNDTDKGRYFDSGSWATLPNGFSFYTGGVFSGLTLEAWVYPTDFNWGASLGLNWNARWARIMEFGRGPNLDDITLTRENFSNNINFSVWAGANPTNLNVVNALIPGEWQHIVATLDASGYAYLYRNGQPLGREQLQVPANVTRTQNYIARSNWYSGNSAGTDEMWRGYIDEVAVYYTALNSQQVANHYNVSKDQYGYINFDKNGLKLYQTTTPGTGGTVVTHIDPVSGAGVFRGTIDSGAILSGSIFGASITGSTFRSSSGSKRLEIHDTDDSLYFYGGDVAEISPARINIEKGGRYQSSSIYDSFAINGVNLGGGQAVPYFGMHSNGGGSPFPNTQIEIQADEINFNVGAVKTIRFTGTGAATFLGPVTTSGSGSDITSGGRVMAYGGFRTYSQSNVFWLNWTGSDTQIMIDGNVTATIPGFTTTKSFIIDHPTDEERYLVHGCLEGPEAGVYYRGEDQCVEGICIVKLPDYFEVATRKGDRTIHVTPIYDHGHLPQIYVSPVEDGRFVVHSTGASTRFYWEVKAVRSDVEILDPEPLRSAVKVYGQGPYRWIG